MSASIEIKGLDKLLRKLDPKKQDVYLKQALQGAGQLILKDMRHYPPRIPDSTYVRTTTLGPSWKLKISTGGRSFLAVIGSRLNYAPYVQDRDRQAKCHRGRWQTIQSVAEDQKATIGQFMVRAIRRWMRG